MRTKNISDVESMTGVPQSGNLIKYLYIEAVNDHPKLKDYYGVLKPEIKLELLDQKYLNVVGQIGFSVTAKIQKTRKVFIKIPPVNPDDENLSAQCENLTTRLTSEFDKYKVWNRIYDRLETDGKSEGVMSFTVSRPLARCSIKCDVNGNIVSVPALLYEFIDKESDTTELSLSSLLTLNLGEINRIVKDIRTKFSNIKPSNCVKKTEFDDISSWVTEVGKIKKYISEGDKNISRIKEIADNECFNSCCKVKELKELVELKKKLIEMLDLSKAFLEFAKSLSRGVQLMHNNGIFHSFIVPRNILKINQNENDKKKNKPSYAIVGYGYTALCNTEHIKADQVNNGDRRYRAPECDDDDNLGALWFPSDIYSIGAILYRIAMGEDPPLPSDLPRDVQRLKKQIYDKLKAKQILFRGNENILKIIDKCLRYRPEDRFSCAEELIDLIDIAKYKPTDKDHEIGDPSEKGLRKNARGLANIEARSNNNQVILPFQTLVTYLTNKLIEDAQQCGRGHYEVYGHRDVLVTSLCRLLANAQQGDVYKTMSMCSYWTDDNLGSNGRFLTMNKHLARRGLKIKRIFRVAQSFHELSESEQKVLEHHFQAYLDLKDQEKEDNFDIVVYQEEDSEKLLDFEIKASPVAYLAKVNPQGEEEDVVCFNFISRGSIEWNRGLKKMHRSINKIRYWSPKMIDRKDPHEKEKKDFEIMFKDSVSLAKYMGRDTLLGDGISNLPSLETVLRSSSE